LLLLAGLFGGLLLGVGAALLLAQLDQTFKSADEAEARLGVPAVGQLVFDRQLARAGQLLVMQQPDSLLAEGIRSLRANIAISARLEGRKVILFTSAVPNEGKTMAACNYAVALEQQKVRTVIVDLDLRCPRVGNVFGLKPEACGVSDYLLGQAPLDSIIHPTDFPNLEVIPAGRPVPNPAEQLAAPWLAQLFKELRSRYEGVVLDTAPVNPVSDTLTFIGQADLALLTVCGRFTSAKTAQQALAAIQRAGIRPAGLVLNRMPAHQSYYSYKYAYGGAVKTQAAVTA
jgi:capsular exopolysaccharide synthesis family protein